MSLPQNVLRGVGAYYDPHFSKVVLLLQDVGSGAAVVDRSKYARPITKAGTISQYTSGMRFGMPGVGFPSSPGSTVHRVYTAASDDFRLNAGAWTLEERFTLTGLPSSASGGGSLPAGSALFALGGTGSSWGGLGMYMMLIVTSAGLLKLFVQSGTSASSELIHPTAVTVGVEHYVRVVHDGATTLTVELDGVASSWTISMPAHGTTPLARVGNRGGAASDAPYENVRGAVWSARLTVGVARPSWVGHRNLPFPILNGTANIYVPGDGSGGPPPATDPLAPKGQWATTTEQTWTVPADVTAVSIVCIGMKASIGGTPVCSAQPGALVGDYTGAGGAGGDGGTWRELVPNPAYNPGGSGGAGFGGGGSEPQYIWQEGQYDGGGGGAGGYGAAGGNGGDVSNRPLGAGAGGRNQGPSVNSGSAGQGASLLGISPGGGTLYGGGAYGNATVGQAGNALAAKNAIAVTPGQTITFQYISGGNTSRAARVMWGGSRSFPYAAANI